jgi:hypothetical protein
MNFDVLRDVCPPLSSDEGPLRPLRIALPPLHEAPLIDVEIGWCHLNEALDETSRSPRAPKPRLRQGMSKRTHRDEAPQTLRVWSAPLREALQKTSRWRRATSMKHVRRHRVGSAPKGTKRVRRYRDGSHLIRFSQRTATGNVQMLDRCAGASCRRGVSCPQRGWSRYGPSVIRSSWRRRPREAPWIPLPCKAKSTRSSSASGTGSSTPRSADHVGRLRTRRPGRGLDFFDCASWAAAAYAGDFPRTDRKSWFGQNRGRALGAWYQKKRYQRYFEDFCRA